MADKKQSMFGHQTTGQTNSRMAKMNELMNDDFPQEEPVEPQRVETLAPGDLEQLIFLGCIEDSKDIGGYKFDMRTLTGKEQNDVWVSVSFLNNETKFFVVKIAFLARAIMAVNGRALDMLYTGKDFRDLTKEGRCVRVIESWQESLVTELYNFYSEMVDRSKKAIDQEQLKK